MAVEGPLAWLVDLGFHIERGPRLHADGVLDRVPLARANIENGPHAMQVHRVCHHGFVDEFEANALTVLQANRLRIFVFHTVNAPGVALHVPGQSQLNLAGRFAVFV